MSDLLLGLARTPQVNMPPARLPQAQAEECLAMAKCAPLDEIMKLRPELVLVHLLGHIMPTAGVRSLSEQRGGRGLS